MYNIPTQVNDNNYKPKRKAHPIIFLLFVVPISIVLFLVGFTYIKVFNTHGHSMQPTINDDSIVVCIKSKEINKGDIIAFDSRGETKIKRVIATEGDVVNINKKGEVTVNGNLLKEEYLSSTVFGETEIPMPHTVEPHSYFVLGDNRGNSLDSRHYNIGDIRVDKIICKVKYVL
ncbi:MAG: signal peptidase I [Firmicutes bacterium]|nr:signal peptidase I [Bacillota bacterium]